MLKVRYIADGVTNDVENLLNDFIKENSMEFSVFASVWKKHNFSLIFMGRQGHKELLDFTHELYRITTQFLTSSSYLYQVGGIFLLYALYRNQLLKPPVKVRILLCQWKNIAKIREEARIKKYMTLHYVIDYLVENAFDFVACQNLMGPRISCLKQLSKKPDKMSKFAGCLKTDLIELQQSNVLQQLKDVYMDYAELKKDIRTRTIMKSEMTKAELASEYDDYLKRLNNLIKENICAPISNTETEVTEENIGSRRAHIKAASFSRKTTYRNNDNVDSDDSSDEPLEEPKEEESIKTAVRKRRVPKEQRRIGRPRKNPVKVEKIEPSEEINEVLDICSVLEEKDKYLLPESKPPSIDKKTKRIITKRDKPQKRRYYYDEKGDVKKVLDAQDYQ